MTGTPNSGIITHQAAYTYDKVGNRQSQTVNGQATNYTYNTLDQLTTDGTNTYTVVRSKISDLDTFYRQISG